MAKANSKINTPTSATSNSAPARLWRLQRQLRAAEIHFPGAAFRVHLPHHQHRGEYENQNGIFQLVELIHSRSQLVRGRR